MLVLAACATSRLATGAPIARQATATASAYRIGVDDEVQVSVWQNPGLDITVPVRPDGKISVPLVGDVDAGGHTPEEVAAYIQEKLAHLRARSAGRGDPDRAAQPRIPVARARHRRGAKRRFPFPIARA